MLWYVLKTWVGREEQLVREVQRTVPPAMYRECFVIYQERIWRKQQRSILHTEPLLPGCVFLTCGESEPLFRRLEMVPSMSRLLACGDMSMLPLMREDVEFLAKLSGPDHLVKLSYVDKTPGGPVLGVTGPLQIFGGDIEKYQFKKRFAAVRHRLWGEEQTFVLGILLNEDLEQGILCQGPEQGILWQGLKIRSEEQMRAIG